MEIHIRSYATEQELFSAWYQCVTCESASPRIDFIGNMSQTTIEKRLQAMSSRRVEPENRVLTLEEVEAYCEGGADATPLWYEGKDHSDANRWMIIDLPEFAFGSMATVKHLANTQFFRATYGEKWRCWLRKPTEAERRETPWES